jgi:hypothetical protein
MPTFAEQLEAATAKLDALLVPAPATVVEETLQLSAVDAVDRITTELTKGVSQERATYLKSVLADLAKNNWETTSFISIKVLDDPTQIKPETAKIAPLQSLTTGEPDIHFATNLKTTIGKAQLIQKFLSDPTAIKKSKLTDKLDDIYTMFSLTKDDLENSYDLSWKISDLVSALQRAIKLERLVDGGGVEKSEAAAPAPATVWPRDMAKAEFDPVKKAYVPEASVWNDAPSQR